MKATKTFRIRGNDVQVRIKDLDGAGFVIDARIPSLRVARRFLSHQSYEAYVQAQRKCAAWIEKQLSEDIVLDPLDDSEWV